MRSCRPVSVFFCLKWFKLLAFDLSMQALLPAVFFASGGERVLERRREDGLVPPRARGGTSLCLGVALLLLAIAPPAWAGKIVLRIRAGNRMDETRKVQIKSSLPAGITTNDIINLAGLNLGYDVDSGTYYVHKEVEFGPRETAVFDVEIKDVWVVATEELARLRERAGSLADKLKSTAGAGTGAQLREAIDQAAAQIGESQERTSIKAGARPVDHIRAYEANRERLGRLKKDLGRLENLVLANHRDPGGPLLGTAETVVAQRPRAMSPADYTPVMWRITAFNPSTMLTRTISVTSNLPREIQAQDVLDAGGMDVKKDPQTGNLLVVRDNVEIGPGQTAVFQVKVRDKWNINAPRIADLKTNAVELLNRVKQSGSFEPGVALLQEVVSDLERMSAERGPAALNERYVDFYRVQAVRLDENEAKIARVQSALRPAQYSPRGTFQPRPPTLRTTWLIIYIILGFLAVLTIVVSVRSLGRTKSGKREEESGAGRGT